MKNFSLLIVLNILVLACSGTSKPKKPDNLISKDHMSELLYDMHVINAAKGVNRNLLETHGIIPETFVLTKHNIDSSQFVESNTYYSYYTDDYEAIVAKVKTRLQSEKDGFEALRKAEEEELKRKKDSIKERKKSLKDSVNKNNKNIKSPFSKNNLIKKDSLK